VEVGSNSGRRFIELLSRRKKYGTEVLPHLVRNYFVSECWDQRSASRLTLLHTLMIRLHPQQNSCGLLHKGNGLLGSQVLVFHSIFSLLPLDTGLFR
jgi:hypothetical protein